MKQVYTGIIGVLVGAGMTIGLSPNTGALPSPDENPAIIESYKKVDDNTVEIIRTVIMRGTYSVNEFKVQLAEINQEISQAGNQARIEYLEKFKLLNETRLDGAYDVGVKNALITEVK